jgi:hypothetical protein
MNYMDNFLCGCDALDLTYVRGYFFLESMSDDLRDLSSNERVSLLSSKLRLYANNQLINSSIFTFGGGEFYLNIY